MQETPATGEMPVSKLYPHDEFSQRQLLHTIVDHLPAVLLLRTIALLMAGPRLLAGNGRTTPPSVA
jgi:hypothetical protein